MTRRLYIKLYLAFVAIAVTCVFVSFIIARLFFWHPKPEDHIPGPVKAAVECLAERLPPSGDERLERRVRRRARRFRTQMSLYDRDGTHLASSHDQLPGPKKGQRRGSEIYRTEEFFGVGTRLADGRWLSVATPRWGPDGHPERLAILLAVLALVVAAGCYPIARRITGRIERLQDGVEKLGQGHLSARVDVEGRDEVADLAVAFNDAADRIEGLVERQKRILASASHELRSPLTRMRMAVELLDDGSDASKKLVDGAERDAEELNALIEDVLLAARIDSPDSQWHHAPFDLAELLREEAERVEASVQCADGVHFEGDIRMMRRMLRNLLENAKRYGGGTPIEAELTPGPSAGGESFTIEVRDRGPGVPANDSERIFEPFYRPVGHREGKHGGVGLGLSLVRQVAEHHGGTVTYDPRSGGGSIFRVALPRRG